MKFELVCDDAFDPYSGPGEFDGGEKQVQGCQYLCILQFKMI